MRVTRKLKTCKVSLRSGTSIMENFLSNENDRIIQHSFVKKTLSQIKKGCQESKLF